MLTMTPPLGVMQGGLPSGNPHAPHHIRSSQAIGTHLWHRTFHTSADRAWMHSTLNHGAGAIADERSDELMESKVDAKGHSAAIALPCGTASDKASRTLRASIT